MLKASEIERVSMVLDKPLRDLEMQIMEDIVRRIKINGEITRSADWQIYRLHELGMSKREIKKAIADNLDLSKAEIKELYNDILQKAMNGTIVYTRPKAKHGSPLKKMRACKGCCRLYRSRLRGSLKHISVTRICSKTA